MAISGRGKIAILKPRMLGDLVDMLQRMYRPILLALCLFFIEGGGSPSFAQETLLPLVREALQRMDDGIASKTDEALLFMNNDLINSAAFNNEISDDSYQRAQGAYAKLNQEFGFDAARQANAEFKVQVSKNPYYSPGTDSDYITVVTSKEQIREMRNSYNDQINAYLQKHGLIDRPRNNWHQRLDTDFMADPRYVTEAEFRAIGGLNNDAYTRRHAAEFESIIRVEGGPGRIDPPHIVAYTEEMNDFAKKKGKLLDKWLANPSRFNDPVKRAETFRVMAQQQKYISRIELAEDILRKQEGLPPRPRGTGGSLASKGAKRAWENSASIKKGFQESQKSLLKSIENISESMAKVATTNPQFKARAGEDIAALAKLLPSEQQANALVKVKLHGGAGLFDDVLDSAKRNNISLASIDDVKAVSKLDDAGRVLSKLDDAADAAKKLSRFAWATQGAVKALGTIGIAGDLYEVGSYLKTGLEEGLKSQDPSLSAAERKKHFESMKAAMRWAGAHGSLAVLMEKYPSVAAVMGSWYAGQLAGWGISQTETGGWIGEAYEIGFDKHVAAWDRFWQNDPEPNANLKSDLCISYVRAIKRGAVKLKPGATVLKVCQYIQEGALDEVHEFLIDSAPVAPPTQKAPFVKEVAVVDESKIPGAKSNCPKARAKNLPYSSELCKLEELEARLKDNIASLNEARKILKAHEQFEPKALSALQIFSVTDKRVSEVSETVERLNVLEGLILQKSSNSICENGSKTQSELIGSLHQEWTTEEVKVATALIGNMQKEFSAYETSFNDFKSDCGEIDGVNGQAIQGGTLAQNFTEIEAALNALSDASKNSSNDLLTAFKHAMEIEPVQHSAKYHRKRVEALDPEKLNAALIARSKTCHPNTLNRIKSALEYYSQKLEGLEETSARVGTLPRNSNFLEKVAEKTAHCKPENNSEFTAHTETARSLSDQLIAELKRNAGAQNVDVQAEVKKGHRWLNSINFKYAAEGMNVVGYCQGISNIIVRAAPIYNAGELKSYKSVLEWASSFLPRQIGNATRNTDSTLTSSVDLCSLLAKQITSRIGTVEELENTIYVGSTALSNCEIDQAKNALSSLSKNGMPHRGEVPILIDTIQKSVRHHENLSIASATLTKQSTASLEVVLSETEYVQLHCPNLSIPIHQEVERRRKEVAAKAEDTEAARKNRICFEQLGEHAEYNGLLSTADTIKCACKTSHVLATNKKSCVKPFSEEVGNAERYELSGTWDLGISLKTKTNLCKEMAVASFTFSGATVAMESTKGIWSPLLRMPGNKFTSELRLQADRKPYLTMTWLLTSPSSGEAILVSGFGGDSCHYSFSAR